MERNIVMSKKKKKNKTPTNLDLWNSIRRNWNGINPVSRIEENKKKKPTKHKKRDLEKAYD